MFTGGGSAAIFSSDGDTCYRTTGILPLPEKNHGQDARATLVRLRKQNFRIAFLAGVNALA